MSLPVDLWSAIYTKLNGTTAVKNLLAAATAIYHASAPDNASFPYIIFNVQAGGPQNITASDLRDNVYNIRAVSSTSMKQAGDIDTAISAALHDGTLTVTGYTNFWLRRETDFAFSQILPNGTKAYISGGLYRIRLTA